MDTTIGERLRARLARYLEWRGDGAMEELVSMGAPNVETLRGFRDGKSDTRLSSAEKIDAALRVAEKAMPPSVAAPTYTIQGVTDRHIDEVSGIMRATLAYIDNPAFPMDAKVRALGGFFEAASRAVNGVRKR